jgi:hypothetical protein
MNSFEWKRQCLHYRQGGPYREYDIMVWDAKEKRTERMTVDSMFTVADRQTYQDIVEFNVGDSRITV